MIVLNGMLGLYFNQSVGDCFLFLDQENAFAGYELCSLLE